jgi:hypothetical protein
MIVITTTRSVAHVELQPPTSTALAVIRGVPRRTWMPRKRCWAIPLRLVTAASEMFADAGFRVVVDGAVQRCPGNPFPAVKASMDPPTWRRVASALAETLDPQNGGDERLHHLLQRTLKAAREQQAS